jgi:membrane carboxypeptidase/penicillin-binding protein
MKMSSPSEFWHQSMSMTLFNGGKGKAGAADLGRVDGKTGTNKAVSKTWHPD